MIAISAGHAKQGNKFSGAVGFMSESFENRNVTHGIIKMFNEANLSWADCTVDSGKTKTAIVNESCIKTNNSGAEMALQIHFNSSDNESATGCECLIYPKSKARNLAEKICSNLSNIGFKNRGVKERDDLIFLKKTNMPAILIEICFVSNKDDVSLYNNKKDEVIASIGKSVINYFYGKPESNDNNPLAWYNSFQFKEELSVLLNCNKEELLSKVPTISKTKNNRHIVVWCLQKRLCSLGYDVGNIDGIAGVKFDNATKSFQRNFMSNPDGEFTAGKTSWRKILEA